MSRNWLKHTLLGWAIRVYRRPITERMNWLEKATVAFAILNAGINLINGIESHAWRDFNTAFVWGLLAAWVFLAMKWRTRYYQDEKILAGWEREFATMAHGSACAIQLIKENKRLSEELHQDKPWLHKTEN